MNKKLSFLILLLPIVTFAMEGSPELNSTEVKSSLIPKTAANKPIVIRQSQRTFKIELPANATTGYQWVLKSDYNTNFIKAKSHKYIAPKPQKDGKALIGAPGVAVFKFEVNKKFKAAPQILDLHFAYIRFWDATDQPTYKTIQIISASQ